jgi:hypothetical protein
LDEVYDKRPTPEENWRTALSYQTSPETLEALSWSLDERVREAVAENIRTPRDVLARLAKDEDDDVRVKVAANDLTPKSAQLALAYDKQQKVLLALAGNELAAPAALSVLANYRGSEEQPDELVRLAVARNGSTPPDVLANLASKEQPLDVRASVAANHSADPSLLAQLSSDPEPQIRVAVAHNSSRPPEVLARLLTDPDPAVRSAAGQAYGRMELKSAASRESDAVKSRALAYAAFLLRGPDLTEPLKRRPGKSLSNESGTLMSIGILGAAALDALANMTGAAQKPPNRLPGVD